MRLVLRTALRSVTGAHRATNQDSAAAGPGFALVADGVGGHAGGDVASRAVTRTVTTAVAGTAVAERDDDGLRALVAAANAAVAERGTDPRLAGLATTFTALFVGPEDLRVAHVGDSRAYVVQGGVGRRVTHDDSYVQLLVDAGSLPAEDAWWHPQRNLLLHSLAGVPDDIEHLWLLHVEAAAGDRWLLCSDGLTDYVAEEEVLAMLAGAADAEAAAETLVAAALEADARDNVTVAVCDVLVSDALVGDEAADGSTGTSGDVADEPVRLVGAAEALGGPAEPEEPEPGEAEPEPEPAQCADAPPA